MRAAPTSMLWMGSAFLAAVLCASLMFVVLGTGERGTVGALFLTGRVAFLLFWPAYVGSSLVTIFGPAFQRLKNQGRNLGLAFAAAQTVHLALVGWLCSLGAAPALQVFLVFGLAAVCIYLLAFGSIARVRRAMGERGWWFVRVFGMNYIAYAFASDFVQFGAQFSAKFVVTYVPFAVLSVLGPALVLSAVTLRKAQAWRRSPAGIGRRR